MIKKSIRVFLGPLIALVPCLPPSAQTATHALDLPPTAIPMDHQSGLLQIEVKIDGQGPFLFQLDTYASIDACVDEKFAKRMGFIKTGTTLNSDGQRTQRRDLVRIDDLHLGEVGFKALTALVDDYGWIDEDGREIHGLLGFPLFRKLLLTIDYPNSQLVLQSGRLGADEPHCMPMTLTTGSPDIILNLGDEPTLFGIDTGMAMPMLLLLEDAERLGLGGELRPKGQARTVYSSFDLFEAQLQETLDLAGHALEDPMAYFRSGKVKRLVGKGLLAPYALTFDQRNKRLRIVVPRTKPASSLLPSSGC